MRILLSFILLYVCSAHAVVDTYEFDNDVMRDRYHSFVEELRCPKCQNQNLAGSNSPIASDLRRELHRLLHEGLSDQQITDYMVNRYGDFILYRPQFNSETALLWLAPVIFLAFGAMIVLVILRRQKVAVKREGSDIFADEDQQKLKQLLQDNSVVESQDTNSQIKE